MAERLGLGLIPGAGWRQDGRARGRRGGLRRDLCRRGQQRRARDGVADGRGHPTDHSRHLDRQYPHAPLLRLRQGGGPDRRCHRGADVPRSRHEPSARQRRPRRRNAIACRGSSRPSAPPGSICRSCPHRSASTAHARSYARSGVEPILPGLRREAALLDQ